ncbi:MAG TPA: hypothetical protein VIL20_04615, partial [Sandaracinaceae bacterium]
PGPDAETGPPPVPPDAGPPAPPPGACEAGELVPPYEGLGCSVETLACLDTCNADPMPAACGDACITGDPECVRCFDQTLIACANRRSCQAPWNAFACCTETRCPTVGGGLMRLACAAEGACLAELDAYASCLDGAFEPCTSEIARCFAP